MTLPGFIITPDGIREKELTGEEIIRRDEIRAENEARKAAKDAEKEAKKEALKVADNADLDGLRDVVKLLAGYEVARDD